jgi:hypothetical protein
MAGIAQEQGIETILAYEAWEECLESISEIIHVLSIDYVQAPFSHCLVSPTCSELDMDRETLIFWNNSRV